MKNNCINGKTNKTLKGFGLLRKLSTIQNLPTIYKTFIRRHFGYGNVMYNQPLNEPLSNRIESVKCQAGLATSGSIQGTSRKKF